jgi:hypothetical protein
MTSKHRHRQLPHVNEDGMLLVQNRAAVVARPRVSL